MTKTDFLDQVAVEIGGRIGKGGKLTDQQKDDWYFFCRHFTIDAAIRNIQEFFRGYEGRFAPKPNEFGLWLRQQGRQPEVDTSGLFFSAEALKFPKVSLVHFSHRAGDQTVEHYGWIERTPECDYAFWWNRETSGLYVVRAFTAPQGSSHGVRITLKGEMPIGQRKDWLFGRYVRVDPPLGLVVLLEGNV